MRRNVLLNVNRREALVPQPIRGDKRRASCEHAYVFHVGDVIRKQRRQRGWSIEELAAKSGVNKGTISGLERGDVTNFRQDTIRKIAAALETTDEAIFMEVANVRQRLEDPLKVFRDRLAHPFSELDEALLLTPTGGPEPLRSSVRELLTRCDELNDLGIERLSEQAELLAQVDRYRRDAAKRIEKKGR
jgi:transcriptional regulator with XRE-family HTH domain